MQGLFALRHPRLARCLPRLARGSALTALITLATVLLPVISHARSDMDARVSRLETIVANELNNKLLNEIAAMQQEIRELHGKLEEQQNSMQALNQKQERLFLNLDARLNNISANANNNNNEVRVNSVNVAPIAEPLAPPAPPVPQHNKAQSNVQHNVQSSVQTSTPATSERAMFETANALLRNKQYADAILEFKDLLWQFPEGLYAVHAYYWLGELYTQQWQQNKSDKHALTQAKEAFSAITNKYQGQEREGDALLKLALLEMEQDHLALAKDMLMQVVAKFPNTARARIAETNLARIQQIRLEPRT